MGRRLEALGGNEHRQQLTLAPTGSSASHGFAGAGRRTRTNLGHAVVTANWPGKSTQGNKCFPQLVK